LDATLNCYLRPDSFIITYNCVGLFYLIYCLFYFNLKPVIILLLLFCLQIRSASIRSDFAAKGRL